MNVDCILDFRRSGAILILKNLNVSSYIGQVSREWRDWHRQELG